MFSVKISSVFLEGKWAKVANLRSFHRSFENEKVRYSLNLEGK